MIALITNIFRPNEVTHSDLGKLGGDPHFTPPSPDRSQQIQQGQTVTATHSAIEPWWYRL